MINCDDLNSCKELIRKSIEWHVSLIPDFGQSVDKKILEVYGSETLDLVVAMRYAISVSDKNSVLNLGGKYEFKICNLENVWSIGFSFSRHCKRR